MIIDGKEYSPTYEFTFPETGNHTVYFLIKNDIETLYYSFYWIRNLIYISFSPIFNTENVLSTEEMFYWCDSLVSIDISNFNTKNLVTTRNMFYWCISLTSIDVSNFNTEKVQDMSNMFKDCVSLTF